MGSTYKYVSGATKDALIQKIWNDSSIQADYSIQASNPSALGSLITQISQVILGYGDDPTVVNDYAQMKASEGIGLTVTEQAALANATQATNAPVPRPFGTDVVSGYDFGQSPPPGGFAGTGPIPGWPTHMGVDYGTTAGSRIVSPFAGTATVTHDQWNGNLVTITLDNGWKMSFGHVASGEVQDGTRVNPGDLIAIAGQNVGDSKGSVTLVTWQDPSGKYINPHDVLDPIFAGATFNAIGAGGAAGTGMPTVNKVLDAEYPSIKNDWQTYFGSPPSPEDVSNVLGHGSSPAQWTDYIRSLPSSIGGLTLGQSNDMHNSQGSGIADQASMKILGHVATDGIVKDLYAQNLTSPQAVTNWYNEHGVTGIDPQTYDKIYKANNQVFKNIFNEPNGFDPRIAKAQTVARGDMAGHE